MYITLKKLIFDQPSFYHRHFEGMCLVKRWIRVLCQYSSDFYGRCHQDFDGKVLTRDGKIEINSNLLIKTINPKGSIDLSISQINSAKNSQLFYLWQLMKWIYITDLKSFRFGMEGSQELFPYSWVLMSVFLSFLNAKVWTISFRPNDCCSRNLSTTINFYDRYQTASYETKLSCNPCKKEFGMKRYLNQHIRLVQKREPTYANFECGHSQQVFTSVDNCVKHLRTFHKFSNTYLFGACLLLFGTCSSLHNQTQNVHPESQDKERRSATFTQPKLVYQKGSAISSHFQNFCVVPEEDHVDPSAILPDK